MIIELNSSWQMRQLPNTDALQVSGNSGCLNNLQSSCSAKSAGEFLPASVPGSVYSTLLANGLMEDPFFRANEEKALPLMNHDYEFVTRFDCPKELASCEHILLHFDGIDTLADIYLNGQHLGFADNMHRIWEYDVTDILFSVENDLRLVFHSPTRFIAESYAEKPIQGCGEAMRGLSYLRKAHCMFGWDWGPRLPDAGLFRPVRLIGVDTARIDSVLITQDHTPDAVTLTVSVEMDPGIPVSDPVSGSSCQAVIHPASHRFGSTFSSASSPYDTDLLLDTLSYRVRITAPDGSVSEFENSPKTLRIEHPQLWWPNGFGEQPLYTVCIELLDGPDDNPVILDVWERRIGLRTLTIRREKDEYGESFAHEVNGVSIFAMGADYIPEDNILSRVTKERTRRLLQDAKAAHYNVIRVWGGGYYPEDFFYDLCDELGLIVWQDFMFACCSYRLTDAFEANLTAEFIDNIKRLRHHASLGLWCGNNEIETFIVGNRSYWCLDPAEYGDYIRLFEYILPKLTAAYSPQTFYWPASPSSGGSFDNPDDANRGDVHYWDVWHGNKPFTEYRKFFFRYVSEFGFQSFPSLKTVEQFTLPEDRNIFSYVMERHQRNAAANGKIMNYMEQTFLYPSNFETLLYASQLLQAEAIRYGVEHFRRSRGRCMGSIVWQLNDCWPVASWSSIDYYGRWKALHYYEKRFFAPLMISCQEEGTLTQDPNVNAQPYPLKKSISLCVSNEQMSSADATVFWELRNADAKILRQESIPVTVAPLSSLWLDTVELPDADIYENYVSYRIEQNGTTISNGTVLFCAPKFFRFRNPKLSVRADGDLLTVSGNCYAKSVRIWNDADDLKLDDNYFDLNGGTRTVRILEGNPEGLRVMSVYDIR